MTQSLHSECKSVTPRPISTIKTATFNLRWLLNPIAPDTFKQEYWERRPLVIRRGDSNYYTGLLSLVDVDHIFSLSTIRASQVRIVREGKEISVDGLTANPALGNAGVLESLYAEYRHGSTIVLPFLHERWEPLQRLCWSLAAEFPASLQVNAYLTPANARGLKTHYDIHDVFVLQTEGSKHWRLYEGPMRLPHKGQPYDAETMKAGELLEEIDLHPGDLIYIPRGCMHDAVSGDSVSLHLTVGINTITWADLIIRHLESVIEKDSRFRESLPVGFASNDELRKLAETYLAKLLTIVSNQAEPARFIDDAVQATLLNGQSVLDGYLLDLEATQSVQLQTRVRRRPEIQLRLTMTEETATLYFYGKAVQFPVYAEPDLGFIAEADEFSADELPGRLDNEGKLFLIKTLIGEGLLTVCRRTSMPKA